MNAYSRRNASYPWWSHPLIVRAHHGHAGVHQDEGWIGRDMGAGEGRPRVQRTKGNQVPKCQRCLGARKQRIRSLGQWPTIVDVSVGEFDPVEGGADINVDFVTHVRLQLQQLRCAHASRSGRH